LTKYSFRCILSNIWYSIGVFLLNKMKKPSNLTSRQQNFINLLDKIRPSKHRFEVFNDWLILASSALYSWKKDKNVEDEYMGIIKHYSADEQSQLNQLLVLTVEALEEKRHDFLGEVFTIGDLTNDRNGQFFTPFNVSLFMANVIIGGTKPKNKRVIKFNDPCCGAGGLLIAGAIAFEENKINYQKDVPFIGTDIDHRCARMAFIQLSLIAVPAIIICGNTITEEYFWQRETLSYHISGMEKKLNIEKIFDLITDSGSQGEDSKSGKIN